MWLPNCQILFGKDDDEVEEEEEEEEEEKKKKKKKKKSNKQKQHTQKHDSNSQKSTSLSQLISRGDLWQKQCSQLVNYTRNGVKNNKNKTISG